MRLIQVLIMTLVFVLLAACSGESETASGEGQSTMETAHKSTAPNHQVNQAEQASIRMRCVVDGQEMEFATNQDGNVFVVGDNVIPQERWTGAVQKSADGLKFIWNNKEQEYYLDFDKGVGVLSQNKMDTKLSCQKDG